MTHRHRKPSLRQRKQMLARLADCKKKTNKKHAKQMPEISKAEVKVGRGKKKHKTQTKPNNKNNKIQEPCGYYRLIIQIWESWEVSNHRLTISCRNGRERYSTPSNYCNHPNQKLHLSYLRGFNMLVLPVWALGCSVLQSCEHIILKNM